MSESAHRSLSYFRLLFSPRVIIFAVVLLHLVTTHIWVARWYQEFGNGPIGVYPDWRLNVPYVLLFAAIALLIGKWWTYLPALLVSLWLLYSVGYAGLIAASRAHDLSLFSFSVIRAWFNEKYPMQSQEFLQLALALVIVGYAAFALSREWRRKIA